MSESNSSSCQVVKILDYTQQLEESSSPQKADTTREDEKSQSSTDPDADKTRSEKEKIFKTSQRSLRRASGAGSPNSLTCIPRVPAFDFSEQDEEQSLPSPKPVPVKKGETGKSTMLMPEVMETSETESAKGSFECEVLEAPAAPESLPPSLPVPEKAFPNLPNSLLHKLGINRFGPVLSGVCGDNELESKFLTLALAFKTDKMTLPKRLEIQKRQRDIAERDVENEIKAIKDSLNYLNLNATTSETRDLITKLQNHIDIVSLATSKVSARSETYGAVKQEERVSCAFEVMMLHVENLKRLFDKEHRELEETKQILSGTRVQCRELGRTEGMVDEHKRSLKTIGLAVGSIKSVVRRRASVAEFFQVSSHKTPSPASFRHGSISEVKDTRSRLFSALSPFTSSHSIGLNSGSSSTPLCTPCSWPSSQANGSRRCSLPVSPLSGTTLPSRTAETRRKDSSSLNTSLSELKISVAPSLSPVADEEASENENEDEPVVEATSTDEALSDSSITYVELHHENIPREDEQIDNFENLIDSISSRDSENCFTMAETAGSFLDRLGCPAVLRVYQTTSALNLIRYGASFFLGFMALVILVVTFLPLNSCYADNQHMNRFIEMLQDLLFDTVRSRHVV